MANFRPPRSKPKDWLNFKVFRTVRDTDTGKFIGFRDTHIRVTGLTASDCIQHAKDFVSEPVLEEVKA